MNCDKSLDKPRINFFILLPEELQETTLTKAHCITTLSRCKRVSQYWKNFIYEKKIFDRCFLICKPSESLINHWENLLAQYNTPELSEFNSKVAKRIKDDSLNVEREIRLTICNPKLRQSSICYKLLSCLEDEKLCEANVQLLHHILMLFLKQKDPHQSLLWTLFNKIYEPTKLNPTKNLYNIVTKKSERPRLHHLLDSLKMSEITSGKKFFINEIDRTLRQLGNFQINTDARAYYIEWISILILLTRDRNQAVSSYAYETLLKLNNAVNAQPSVFRNFDVSDRLRLKKGISIINAIWGDFQTIFPALLGFILTYAFGVEDKKMQNQFSKAILWSFGICALVLNLLVLRDFIKSVKTSIEFDTSYGFFSSGFSKFLMGNLIFLLCLYGYLNN